MDKQSKKQKPLTLHEILEHIENWSDDESPRQIFICPPEDANAAITDEDSGEEDEVYINNLPGSQLRAEAELMKQSNDDSSDDSSEEDEVCPTNLPGSQLRAEAELMKQFNNDSSDDSGEDDEVCLTNIPGTHLRTEGEIRSQIDVDSENSEDDVYLSALATRKKVSRKRKAIPIQPAVGKRKAIPMKPAAGRRKVIPKKYADGRLKAIPTKPAARKRRTIPIKPAVMWLKKDIEPTLPGWLPVAGCKRELSPMEAFFNIFDDEVVDLVAKFTNMYAISHNRVGNLDKNEIWCFFGILLLSGYCPVPRREMYWENSKDANNALVCEAMSRNRFRFIMQNIHCCDNSAVDQNDKFAEIRPLFDVIARKFQDFAPLEECHSVDESMVPYYGRHGTKQFIRGKPIRWGYKIWTGTNRLGYIEWFELYQGASTPLDGKYKHLGLGASIVLQFADVLQTKYPNIPFDIYFDNFFTSINLLKEMRTRNLKGTGTVRENRLGKQFPLSRSKELKHEERGFYEYVVSLDNAVVVCKWVDNSIVEIASNDCPVLPTATVERYSQAEKKKINVKQPKLIKKYNKNMGGVDRADENISLYRTSIRGKKWYFPLITHSLDMATQNSWHLYRSGGGKLDQLGFRRQIATALLESFKKASKRGPSKLSSILQAYSRLDGKGHLVQYKPTQTRSICCHKKVNFFCQKCNIALHPKECFMAYHTLENFSSVK